MIFLLKYIKNDRRNQVRIINRKAVTNVHTHSNYHLMKKYSDNDIKKYHFIQQTFYCNKYFGFQSLGSSGETNVPSLWRNSNTVDSGN